MLLLKLKHCNNSVSGDIIDIMKKHKYYRGFTVIEVVLVLAIAGLIFLMVFLALPALQRSQRDTQRKNDARNLLAAIIEFQSHNKGQKPFNDGNNAWTKLKPYWNKSNLLNDRPPGHIDDFAFFNSKTETIVEYSKLGSAWHPAGDWNVVLGVVCTPGDKGGYYLKYGGSVPKKSMAVTVELESVQTDAYGGGWGYCIDTENN